MSTTQWKIKRSPSSQNQADHWVEALLFIGSLPYPGKDVKSFKWEPPMAFSEDLCERFWRKATFKVSACAPENQIWLNANLPAARNCGGKWWQGIHVAVPALFRVAPTHDSSFFGCSPCGPNSFQLQLTFTTEVVSWKESDRGHNEDTTVLRKEILHEHQPQSFFCHCSWGLMQVYTLLQLGLSRVWCADTVDGRNPANHLTCMKPCKYWNMSHINWCRISSINLVSFTITERPLTVWVLYYSCFILVIPITTWADLCTSLRKVDSILT